MSGLDLAIPAASFLDDYANELTAAGSVLVAVVLAMVVDRALTHRGGQRLAQALPGELTPVASTRLRFVRRLISAFIVVVGVAIALTQFDALDRVATSVLASGALAAAVIGFAARQTFANVVAGVMLAITQPLRIGDMVTFEGESGTVEDVRLNYTFIRTGNEARVIVPNERLASGILRNDTIVSPTVGVETSVWLAPDADVDRAIRLLSEGALEAAVQVAEAQPDGIRLQVSGRAGDPAERGAKQAELLADCLRRLRGAGFLPGAPEEPRPS